MRRGSDEVLVLHVDDEPEFLTLAAEFLEREGDIVVDTATSASKGLDRLAERPYDCIVSDLDMPERDGIEFLEAVRDIDADLPFILFTGKGSEEVAATAISAGVSDYLQKETGTDQYTVLANRITNLATQYRAERELDATVNRLNTVVSNFPLVLFALDADGTFTLSEGRGLQQLGLAPGEVVGDSVFDWYGWHDGISEGIQRALDGETVTEIFDVDGTVFDSTFQPVFDESDAVRAVIGVAMDVTERTERERALQRERDRFTALYENFPEPTVTFQFVDDEPLIRAVNDAFVETFGFEPSAVVGESIDDVLVPPDRWEDARDLNKRVRDGEPVDEEVRRQTVDGERLFWFRNIPIPESSEFDGFAVYADITDLKHRERELEQTQAETAQLQALLEHALVSTDTYVWEWDLETGDVERYPTVEPIFGVTSEEIGDVYEGFLDRVHPDDRERVEAAIETGIETGSGYQFECRFETVDGSWRWIRDRAEVQTVDGESVRAIGSVTDVTEQQSRKRRLEQQNERLEELTDRLEDQYNYLFEEAPVMAVVTHDQDGNPIVEDCNQRFLNTLGYESADVIGSELAEFYTDESAEIMLETGYQQAITGGLTRGNRTLVAADGDHVDTLLRAVPARHPDGIDGTLAFYLDITDRKQLKAEKERLDEFADIVSHELRNPLSVAAGKLELISADVDSDHVADVQRALERMDTLVDDLLSLARLGKTAGTKEPVSLQRVTEESWQNIETGAARLSIETDLTLRAAPSRLRQLVENLLANAVTHAGPDCSITVGSLPDGFYVADDGPGIPPEVRDSVFDAGFTTSDDGTGIGLSIVESVAEAHGWDIELTPSEAGGTRFEITGIEVE